jgi:Rrf2 family protein
MRMNEGVEWAVHACTVLAPLWPQHGLSLAALAELHGVPAPYMAKQMQRLSAAGLVRTSRGRTGGYALARAPSEINLWQIARAVDGVVPMFRCTEIRQRGPCGTPRENCTSPCGIAASFASAEMAYRKALEEVSVADMMMQAMANAGSRDMAKVGNWFMENVTQVPGD